jgi:hypothetical protein
VYEHAYFTICVLSAPNCHKRFLNRSQHTFDFSFQSSLYPAARGTYSLHFTGLIHPFDIEHRPIAELSSSPSA